MWGKNRKRGIVVIMFCTSVLFMQEYRKMSSFKQTDGEE